MKFDENNYSALMEKIFSITPSVQNVGFAGGAYKPGLEGMRRFDALLGSPWKQYPTIHIAGTNGKGSVSSMLASALAAGGAKTGLYTSPHLLDFRERIKIIGPDGWEMPSKEEVWEFFQKYDISRLSFFEMTTGLAFERFAAHKADAAVIEVGLGGRLDSTNIISPELCIITSIGLDHCALLGDTRAKIAREKAGIFKKGVPAIVASEDEETAEVFRQVARDAGAPLIFADSADSGIDESAVLERMDLRGPYQAMNLHTALIALQILHNKGLAPSPKSAQTLEALQHTAVRTGLEGRWQKLRDKPETICDIAHNPPALKINFGRLERLGRPLTVVYGIMADKDLDGIAPLMPDGADYILVSPAIPRALPAEELLGRLGKLRPELKLRNAESVASGIAKALRETPENGIVYIGGSTFVVTEALEYFKKAKK